MIFAIFSSPLSSYNYSSPLGLGILAHSYLRSVLESCLSDSDPAAHVGTVQGGILGQSSFRTKLNLTNSDLLRV